MNLFDSKQRKIYFSMRQFDGCIFLIEIITIYMKTQINEAVKDNDFIRKYITWKIHMFAWMILQNTVSLIITDILIPIYDVKNKNSLEKFLIKTAVGANNGEVHHTSKAKTQI